MMYGFILLKSAMHGFIRFLSAGKKGRDVITFGEFRKKLNEAS